MFEKLTAALPRRAWLNPPIGPDEPAASVPTASAAPTPAHSEVAPGHVRLRIPQIFVVQEGRGLSNN